MFNQLVSTTFLFTLLFLTLITPAHSVYFYLEPNQQRCFILQIPINTNILLDYTNLDYADMNTGNTAISTQNTVKLRTYDFAKNVISDVTCRASDRVQFTARVDLEYQVCLEYKHVAMAAKQLQHIRFTLNMIDNADVVYDYENSAKLVHFNAIEIELNKLIARINKVRAEQDSARRAEERFRDVSESRNSRVMWFNIVISIFLISASVFQFMYLKQWFAKKKLV